MLPGGVLGDTVTFAASLDRSTITLQDGSVRVGKSLRIDASALNSLTIDAAGRSRAFTVVTDDGEEVELNGLTITGGSAGGGGGISNYHAALTLTNCVVSDNVSTANYAGGGGIYNYRGVLTVIGSVITRNSALRGSGGGISDYDDGTIVVENSTISRNSANAYGGGIWCAGTLIVTNTRFLGNSATGEYSNGGGMVNTYALQTVVSQCLFSGNTATKRGGAIVVNHGTLTIADSTISGNVARDEGGGLHRIGKSAPTTVHNTIIAGNDASIGSDINDLTGELSGCHNLIGDGAGQTGLHHGENRNLVGTAQAPIAPAFVRDPSDGGDGWGDEPSTPDIDEASNDDYGDLRLRPDSPAIDAGDNSLAADPDGAPLEFDLHGNPRILDGDNDGTATVDMGVFERPAGLEPLPGDLNGDGFVGSSDLDVIRANWGRDVQPGDLLSGDATGDGRVNDEDLNVVRANWGAVAAADAVFDSLADEPTYGDSVHDEPLYGPAPRETATLGKDVRLTPRWLETLAAEAWRREERLKAKG